MKLFGINFSKQNKPEKEVNHFPPVQHIEPPVDKSTVVSTFNFWSQNSFLPPLQTYWYNTQGRYVNFGVDNLFPLQLVDLFNSSPIHASIVIQKAKMVVGEGIEINNNNISSVQEQIKLNKFLTFADGQRSLEAVLNDLSFDWQLFGALALEVMWDETFTSIVRIKRLPVMNIRMGRENQYGEIEEFYFSQDWSRKFIGEPIPVFSRYNKTSQNQLMYIKNPAPDGRYYGIPNYISGANWIAADSAISKFHLSNINNGFSPSVAIKFYQKPQSVEQKDEIVRNIKREYQGQSNAGKALIFFSDGKENAPDIEQVQVSELDKQFTTIADQIVDQIVRAHRGVAPILWGIGTTSKLGTSTEFENAFKIFEKTVLFSDRCILEQLVNRILTINGIKVELALKNFKVFDSQIIPTKPSDTTATIPTTPITGFDKQENI